MHGPWVFFRFFWIFPLLFLAIFLIRTFLVKRRRLSGSAKVSSLPEKEEQTSSGKIPSGKIPEELKEAGRQVLENLDWEIRFLEKQRVEVENPQEKKKIEADLKRKREEYQATVDRLEP